MIDIEEMRGSVGNKEGLKDYNIDDNGDKNGDIHFAIDGGTFKILKEYFPEDAKKIWVKGTVFARMSPDQKESLIGKFNWVTFTMIFCIIK